MRVLVIGGTLFIGRHLTGQLLEAGHEVTILHRRPGHDLGGAVQELIGDRNDIGPLAGVLAGRRFDAVFDNVYDWERGTTAAHVEATARACGGDLHRYVFMSSVGAYQEALDVTEESPLAPEDDGNSYAQNKASSERALFRLHEREGLPVVTLRPPYVYGPDNPFYREAFFWDRLADNRPILVPGDGQRPMHMAYVKDVVRACLAALERPEAVGESFNIADERPVTQDELVRALARAAGYEPRLVHVPRERIEAAGGSGMGPERLYFGMHLDLVPITEVTVKARRLLGFQATPLGDGLAETYAWYREHHSRPAIDYAFEDALLAG